VAVRKRTWRKAGGELLSAWVCDYFDQGGVRRLRTFETKRAADAFMVSAKGEISRGVHTPESQSVTVNEAAQLWLQRAEADGLERSTTEKYKNHIELHIAPYLGNVKLARLSTPVVEQFKDDMLGRLSRPMARKVLISLKSIIAEAERRGLTAKNPARSVRIKPKPREEGRMEIPSVAEVNAILAAAKDRWKPLLLTAAYSGLRASELRGLRWQDVDFERKTITVAQRADAWGTIGAPKSAAGRRTVPMAPPVVKTLREWRLACPRGKGADGEPGQLLLVFPNGAGNVEDLGNIRKHGWVPAQVKAGIARPYGFHSLRHFFASWLIASRSFSPKELQALMGHSSIVQTYDVYGHLLPAPEDDHARFAAAALALGQ
jgi:integrase